MELLIIALIIGALTWFLLRSKSSSSTDRSKAPNARNDDDYDIWLNIFKKDKANIKEFDLFGTRAAVAWNDGDDEAVIICITAFRNGEPITKKWDHYEFNIREKYWAGMQPKGSPARIREELKSLGLI